MKIDAEGEGSKQDLSFCCSWISIAMLKRSIIQLVCIGRSTRSLSGLTLRNLTEDQVCSLLVHCNLVGVQNVVRKENLNGVALAMGVDSEVDLMNIGLKPIFARTFFRHIVEWKTNGLPSDFDVDSDTSLGSTSPTKVKRQSYCNLTMPVVMTNECSHNTTRKEQLRIDYRRARCQDKTAVDRIKQAADAGNHLAEGYLSCYYMDVDYDYCQSVSYAAKAISGVTAEADKGCPAANYLLGRFLMAGSCVEENRLEAVRRFKFAADAGYVEASAELGECYENGNGVEKNYEIAVRYYQIAADEGCPRGQCSLSRCYLYGRGVEQNEKEARRLLQLSAEKGHLYARYLINRA